MRTFNRAEKKIRNFMSYRKGWSYGEGIPFDEETIKNALLFNSILLDGGMPKTNAFPGADGSIMVAAYYSPWRWEFIVEHDKTITIVTEKYGDVVKEQEYLSFNEALYIIFNETLHIINPPVSNLPKATKEGTQESWSFCESSIHSSTIQMERYLLPNPLDRPKKPPTTVRAYPSLIASAYEKVTAQSALISRGITATQTMEKDLSFSGSSIPTNYRRVA